MPDAPRPRRTRWPSLFQEAAGPLFVLFRTRRIRFVNPAWEALTGVPAAAAAGRGCVRGGPTEPLYRTLAPPPEAADRTVTVRRPAPPHRQGPPWWDVTFVPLAAADGAAGYLGLIRVVQPAAGEKPRTVPPVVEALRVTHAAAFSWELLASVAPAGERLLARARLAAETNAPGWVHGEPGSGKETLARVVHHNGPRRSAAFVALDCDGLQPYLLDGLLFGPGGLAGSPRVGTVYLKNPECLPRDVQRRLLDGLLTPAGPRIICGSNTSAEAGVAAGKLVPAFDTACSVLDLRTIPLRERPADMPRLAPPGTPADVLAALATYPWPGNLRELRDTFTRPVRTAADLPRHVRERALIAAAPAVPPPPKLTLDQVLEGVERRMIRHALAATHGNQTDAAALLGVFRTRLGRRIEALGLLKGEPGA